MEYQNDGLNKVTSIERNRFRIRPCTKTFLRTRQTLFTLFLYKRIEGREMRELTGVIFREERCQKRMLNPYRQMLSLKGDRAINVTYQKIRHHFKFFN